jgi:hypothetical protein
MYNTTQKTEIPKTISSFYCSLKIPLVEGIIAVFSPEGHVFEPSGVCKGFVVDEKALGLFSFKDFSFPLPIIISSMSHSYIHSTAINYFYTQDLHTYVWAPIQAWVGYTTGRKQADSRRLM